MKNSANIKMVLFDVGNVLLPLHWDSLVKNLNLKSSEIPSFLKTFSNWEPLALYEKGKLSTEDFLEQINLKLGTQHSATDFKKYWNDFVGSVFPHAEEIVQKLCNKVEIRALSNINELHYEHVLQNNPIFKKFEKFHASHLMGRRKPEKGIFESVLNETKCEPAEIIFFDDLADNIKMAEGLGFQAFLIQNSKQDLQKVLTNFDLLS